MDKIKFLSTNECEKLVDQCLMVRNLVCKKYGDSDSLVEIETVDLSGTKFLVRGFCGGPLEVAEYVKNK